MMKRTCKRLLSLALAVVMLLSLVCTTAFAGTKKTFSYVSVGDSTSMGFNLSDFPIAVYGSGIDERDNYFRYESSETSAYSLHKQMTQYLQQAMPDATIEAQELSMVGMRPAELRAALDEDYFRRMVSDYNEGDTTFNKHVNYTAQKMYWAFYGGDDRVADKTGFENTAYHGYAAFHETYTEALKNADLITYSLMMSDLSSYLGYRFKNMSKELYANDTYAQLMRDENRPDVAERAETLRKAGEKLLGGLGLPMETVNTYLDMLLYTFANFAINFSETMDWIYENNSDAEVIVVGPYNSMEGLTLEVTDGISIDMGKVWKLLLDAMTEYVVDFDSHNKQYQFADLSGGVEMIYTAIEQGKITDSEYSGYILPKLLDNAYNVIQWSGDSIERNDENTALLLRNMAKSISYSTTTLDAAMHMEEYEALSRALRGDANATDGDYTKLNLVLRLNWMSAIGCHPDAKGYQQIFAAVKTAYENEHHTGYNTYVTRFITNTVNLLRNSAKALFGNKTAAAQVQKTIRGFFSPLLRISFK